MPLFTWVIDTPAAHICIAICGSLSTNIAQSRCPSSTRANEQDRPCATIPVASLKPIGCRSKMWHRATTHSSQYKSNYLLPWSPIQVCRVHFQPYSHLHFCNAFILLFGNSEYSSRITRSSRPSQCSLHHREDHLLSRGGARSKSCSNKKSSP
jgi:hypothetical protein